MTQSSKQTTKRFAIAAALALFSSSLLFMVAPAVAETQDGFKVTANKPTGSKTYPALSGTALNRGVQVVNWRTCGDANVEFCDLIRLEFDPEGAWEAWVGTFSLSWPNSGANDLDLGIWIPDDVDPQADRIYRSAGRNHPEVFTITVETPDPAVFHAVVENVSGTNAGYTLSLKINEKPEDDPFVFVPPSRPQRPDRGGGGSAFKPSFPSFDDPFADLNFDEFFTDRAQDQADPFEQDIRIPGSDGEPIDLTIPLVKGVQDAPKDDGGLGPVAWVAIGVAVVGGGFAFWFFFWRRRHQEA